jgi:PPP family 3-phenylpropionic acid transporter
MIVVMALFPTGHTFLTLLPIVLMYSIFNAPFTSILDQTTLVSLDNPANYGKIRVGGSIGWGIMVLITGILVDSYNRGYGIVFYINIIFLIIFLINTLGMPEGHRTDIDPAVHVDFKMIVQMLRQPGMLPVLLLVAIWGIGESSISNFLFLHIKSLGGSSTLMGVSLSISLIGEIVAFSIANKILIKVGPAKMMLLSFVVLFTWLFGLSLIRNPYVIPFFQVYGGSAYALIQSGSVAYVNKRAPKELGTTAQAIRGGVLSGLGVGTGALVSGVIYEASGSVTLFREMSYLIIAGLLIGIVLYFDSRRREKAKAE